MMSDLELYERAAIAAIIDDRPFPTIVDDVRRQAAEQYSGKVIDLAEMRRKLRPHDADPAA
jgi:hypothetical protein